MNCPKCGCYHSEEQIHAAPKSVPASRLTGFYWVRFRQDNDVTIGHWREDVRLWHIVGSEDGYHENELEEIARIEDWMTTQSRRRRKIFRVDYNGTFLGGTAIVAADSPSEAIQILKDSDVQTPREPITATALDSSTEILYINNGDYANA